jgi:hypothetical protein
VSYFDCTLAKSAGRVELCGPALADEGNATGVALSLSFIKRDRQGRVTYRYSTGSAATDAGSKAHAMYYSAYFRAAVNRYEVRFVDGARQWVLFSHDDASAGKNAKSAGLRLSSVGNGGKEPMVQQCVRVRAMKLPKLDKQLPCDRDSELGINYCESASSVFTRRATVVSVGSALRARRD